MSGEIDLEEKFSDLRPINGTPSLFTINGCGLSLYGGRDHDTETGTYIKTQCLTLIFVPLFGLRAFRVADAETGGWYFIGREPLSGLARFWNMLVVVSVAAAVGIGSWVHHVSTPEYIARQQLEEADELANREEWVPAAKKYGEVIVSRTSFQPKAETRLATMYIDAATAASADELLALMNYGQNLWDQGIRIASLAETGLQIVERIAESDSRQAYHILGIVDRLLVDTMETERLDAKRIATVRRKVLEGVLVVDPNHLPAVGELAAILESEGKLPECRKLLEPHAKTFGDSEGARILGQIYANEGEIHEAHALLVPYCKTWLTALHAAETRYNNATQQTYDRLFEELKPGPQHAAFFAKIENLPRDQQQAAAESYVVSQMKNAPELTARESICSKPRESSRSH